MVVRRGGGGGGAGAGFLPVGYLVHVAVGKVIHRRLRWKLKKGPIKSGDPLAGAIVGFIQVWRDCMIEYAAWAGFVWPLDFQTRLLYVLPWGSKYIDNTYIGPQSL